MENVGVKKIDYAGNSAAMQTLDRSLSQSSDCHLSSRACAQSNMGAAHVMAKQARSMNSSNRGA